MVWIETTHTDSTGQAVTRRLKCPGMDDFADFAATGRANVTEDVAELLVERFDTIEYAESADLESDADAASDSDDSDSE